MKNFEGYDDDLDYFNIKYKDISFENLGSEIYIKDNSKTNDNVFCLGEYNQKNSFLEWIEENKRILHPHGFSWTDKNTENNNWGSGDTKDV